MKHTKFISAIILFVGLFFSTCRSPQPLYVQSVQFPEKASLEEKIKSAASVVPSKPQLEWQQLELTAFIHFGINTFTNSEWGTGKESPGLFNPTNFDAVQWVEAIQDAGMKMLILTAKHHDGFCLWPTKTTTHSLAASPWKNGNGDVVKEVKQACEALDMKFGFYLSPWDRNAASYGDSEVYNQLFIAQLTELLTEYGKIDEVWFDGACGEGPNGKKQEYDWEAYYETVYRFQPDAVIAIQGEDIRWVGTETGYGRETEWSVTAYAPGAKAKHIAINQHLGLSETSADLGSRELLKRASKAFWYPAEVDVSIRPGWFWHEAENNQVKSLEKLVDIYFNSVGMNAVLLLNIPPDTRGRIHETDVQRLKEFGKWIKESFQNNLLNQATTDNKKAFAAIDGNPNTYWKLPKKTSSTVFSMPELQQFDMIELQEYIQYGQRIEKFKVEAFIDNKWKEIASGTTIGYKRIIRFNPLITNKIRLNFEETRAQAFISKIGLYKMAEIPLNIETDKEKE